MGSQKDVIGVKVCKRLNPLISRANEDKAPGFNNTSYIYTVLILFVSYERVLLSNDQELS